MNAMFKKIVTIVALIGLVTFAVTFDKHIVLVERTAFLSAIGYDFDKEGDEKYRISASIYDFKGTEKDSSKIEEVSTSNLSNYKEKIQRKLAKTYELGTEKLYIISTRMAEQGINELINNILNVDQISMRTLVVTTDDKPADLLKFHIDGYASGGDYISDNIKSLTEYHFNLTPTMFFDLCKENKNEGYSCILPNINLINGVPIVKDYSILYKGKLLGRIKADNINYIYIMRNDESNGSVNYNRGEKNSFEYMCDAKRRVAVTKKDGKYSFKINLDIKATVNTGNVDNKLNVTAKEKKILEKETALFFSNKFNELIKEFKIKKQVDVLNLGAEAMAKYGERQKDWNSVVGNSDIQVNVNFKIDNLLSANYFEE